MRQEVPVEVSDYNSDYSEIFNIQELQYVLRRAGQITADVQFLDRRFQ
jgi:hypothetical protein